MMKLLCAIVLLTISTAPCYAGFLTDASRMKTYELEWVRNQASIQIVDKILHDCAIVSGQRVSQLLPNETLENFIGILVTSNPAFSKSKITLIRLPSTDAGAQDAVRAIDNVDQETPAYIAARGTIAAALKRALNRQNWLELYRGDATNDASAKVFGFFAVLDRKNKEILVIGDGVCPAKP